MMHMLLGVDALSIGKSPYAPMFVKAKDIEAEEIGIHASRGQDFIVCRQYHLISEQILWQELMSVSFIKQMKMFCLLISERMERLYFQIMEDYFPGFLCRRSGTGRYEHQLRYACGRGSY